jgi:hypothetical protein
MISMVTSRVLSPQYMVWLFGLLAVCAFTSMVNLRKIFTLIAISAFAGQLIYPIFYFPYMEGNIFAVLIQIIRVGSLIWATYLVWQNLRNQKDIYQPTSITQ